MPLGSLFDIEARDFRSGVGIMVSESLESFI